MPKISGREVLSEATEKAQSRLLVASAVACVAKAYTVPVGDLKMLGVELPASIFDVSMFIIVLWYGYTYLVRWAGDMLAFRLWYSESSIWSNFGTNMKLDKTFISGGIEALKTFHDIHQRGMRAEDFASMSDENKRQFDDFKTNVELYGVRLDYAGKKFAAISAFGRFYVWGQGLVLPAAAAGLAIYLLIRFGTFTLPDRF